MTYYAEPAIDDLEGLLAYEAAIDVALCGMPLAGQGKTRFHEQGAHDPTPTHYYVLDELFEHYRFSSTSHLLDVGCGAGRVLAYFAWKGYPGKVTGVELDPHLADKARSWAASRENICVRNGDVLDIDLSGYTDFYLFNPFDSCVLKEFIEALEHQVSGPCTLVHMSDNGETWWYMGRQGWTELASGEMLWYRSPSGATLKAYDHPQHYTVWRYES